MKKLFILLCFAVVLTACTTEGIPPLSNNILKGNSYTFTENATSWHITNTYTFKSAKKADFRIIVVPHRVGGFQQDTVVSILYAYRNDSLLIKHPNQPWGGRPVEITASGDLKFCFENPQLPCNIYYKE